LEKRIFDIVNFNSEASCLPSETWYNALLNGNNSLLYKWLMLYVKNEKRIILGFTGATIVDIAIHNPEVLKLLNDNSEIFEFIVRPFTHDISLLRSKKGFEINMDYGIRTIERNFRNSVIGLYLPPEFMCTSLQINQLSNMGIKGIFINPERFDNQIRRKIPSNPFMVNGVFNSRLLCIPIREGLTNNYLDSIHNFNSKMWNECLLDEDGDIFAWRDGESTFILPETLEREKCWLEQENNSFTRSSLREFLHKQENAEITGNENSSHVYPIHPFLSWVKEMKMYWYISRVEEIEKHINEIDNERVYIWLHIIGSDILSSIEKRSPVISLKESRKYERQNQIMLERQNKGLEGEEYLQIFEDYDEDYIKSYLCNSNSLFIRKLNDRINYLKELDNISVL
jgi:hypothetical protein